MKNTRIKIIVSEKERIDAAAENRNLKTSAFIRETVLNCIETSPEGLLTPIEV